MLKGLYTAYTGMINEQHRMDTLTNNLANASTVGFKKEGATSQSFDDILTVKIKDASYAQRLPQRMGMNNRHWSIIELPVILMIWRWTGRAFLPLNSQIRQERHLLCILGEDSLR